MQLSKRTQYGIRAMICLADAYQRGYLQTRELATREGLPTKFLESILSALTRGKFLSSKIGATGGYRLSRPPKDIRIGDIVSRLEGKKIMEEDSNEEPASQSPGEAAVSLLQSQLSDAIKDVLNKLTLAEMAEAIQQQSRNNQMYYI